MQQLLGIRTFFLVVGQGVCGMTAAKAQSFNVLWYQYSGVSDAQAGILASLGSVGSMIGGVTIGYASDVLTKWSRYHGRPLIGTIMIASVIPLLWILFEPCFFGGQNWDFVHMCFLVFAVGLCLNTGNGVDRPVLADVAPKQAISSTMALDWASHTAVGAIVGPTVVSLGSSAMGYRTLTKQVSEMTVWERQENASALGKAILVLCTFCYLGTCSLYCSINLTYKADIQRRKEEDDMAPLVKGAEYQTL